uniref:Uncharacterized protein n=1 Tax=Anguilla anguilla TaxID=7936 RepID=A0A0E9VMQ5_ANGAN
MQHAISLTDRQGDRTVLVGCYDSGTVKFRLADFRAWGSRRDRICSYTF